MSCACRSYDEQWSHDLMPCTVPFLPQIKMLPTPAKFHYIFNLRDLSRIWQGMINTLGEVVTESKVLLALWKHECTRVIADRFTNPQDCEWFQKTLIRVVQEELGEVMAATAHEDHYFVDFLRWAQSCNSIINPFHTRFWNLHRLCTGSTRFP